MKEKVIAFYKEIVGLNLEECIEIKGELSEKEILIDKELINLKAFVEDNKKLAGEWKFKSPNYMRFIKSKYFEVQEKYEIIIYKYNIIGANINLFMHSGIPKYEKIDYFDEDYEKALERIVKNAKNITNLEYYFNLIFSKPKDTNLTRTYFLPEYNNKIVDAGIKINLEMNKNG